MQAIADIREHPLVRTHQYRIRYFLWLEIWLARLTSDISVQSIQWSVTSIFYDSIMIGHITETRKISTTGFSVELGWNLHPDYWGRGIMTCALTQFITELVSDEECMSVFADCFSNNYRCRRLLSRIGFAESPIGQIERVLICVFRLCHHRILRHELDIAKWRSKHQLEIAN